MILLHLTLLAGCSPAVTVDLQPGDVDSAGVVADSPVATDTGDSPTVTTPTDSAGGTQEDSGAPDSGGSIDSAPQDTGTATSADPCAEVYGYVPDPRQHYYIGEEPVTVAFTIGTAWVCSIECDVTWIEPFLSPWGADLCEVSLALPLLVEDDSAALCLKVATPPPADSAGTCRLRTSAGPMSVTLER